jgi:DNA primase large subunit
MPRMVVLTEECVENIRTILNNYREECHSEDEDFVDEVLNQISEQEIRLLDLLKGHL